MNGHVRLTARIMGHNDDAAADDGDIDCKGKE